MTDRDGLLSFLDLEEIDVDLYRGSEETWPGKRTNIYGGQVAAQALLAAAGTVPDGRRPHSLHGYFLRRGDPDRKVVFRVDRDRDGRSFSARRVAAVQRGEVIFEMACSFQGTEAGPEFTLPRRTGIPTPDAIPAPIDPHWHPVLDVRLAPRPDGSPGGAGSIDRLWTRIVVPLPDDPILHACLLTFMSDIGSGFGDLDIPGIPPFGPTIDHAVWFHGRPRADEWILFDCQPMKVGGGRGLYVGSAHDTGGNLVAMLAQEMLLRTTAPTDAGRT